MMIEKDLGSSQTLMPPVPFLWYSMSILWDGSVVPCCTDFTGEYILGDIRKESSMSMWNGKKLVELRTKINEKRYKEVNLCQGCDILFRPKIFGIPVRSLIGDMVSCGRDTGTGY